jgi:hypothetical protein
VIAAYAKQLALLTLLKQSHLIFALFRIHAKIFETLSKEILAAECQYACNLSPTSNLLNRRKQNNLMKRFFASEDQLCKTFTKLLSTYIDRK